MRSTLADLSRRFGAGSEPTKARVSRTGPSGRAMEVTIEGSGGPVVVDGQTFATTLGLRSKFFTLRIEGLPAPVATPEQVTAAPTPASPRPPPAAVRAGATAPDEPSSRLPWVALAVLLVVAVALFRRTVRTGQEPLP